MHSLQTIHRLNKEEEARILTKYNLTKAASKQVAHQAKLDTIKRILANGGYGPERT